MRKDDTGLGHNETQRTCDAMAEKRAQDVALPNHCMLSRRKVSFVVPAQGAHQHHPQHHALPQRGRQIKDATKQSSGTTGTALTLHRQNGPRAQHCMTTAP
jgi:hypothetical protein